MRAKFLIAGCFHPVLCVHVAVAADLHVPGQFQTIQAAVDASTSGDWILVAPGVYTGDGNRDINPSGRSIRIVGTSGAAATILDCEGTSEEPHRGFFITSGDQTLIIEGLTIRNGHARFGGGIHVLGTGAPLIRNVVVENCSAEIGGGVLIVGSGEETSLVSCDIRGNTADSGGGLEVRDGAATIEDCSITGNSAASFGGGLRVQPGRASMLRCTISNNTAFVGAGAFCYDAEPRFTDSTIDGNFAEANGGGVYIYGGGQLFGCRIVNNIAVGESGGLKFESQGGSTRAENCLIQGNTCSSKGAVTLSDGAAAFLINCNILDNANTGWGGGGIHCEYGSAPCILTCTVSGNSTVYSAGGFLGYDQCQATIEDCIFEGNQSQTECGGITLEGSCQATVSQCVIRGNVGGGETGGLRLTHNDQSRITDSRIEGNLSRAFGAVTVRHDSSPSLLRCTIQDNINMEYGAGGIHCENNADVLVESCIVRSNLSAHVGGVMAVIDSDVELVNALVADNHSSWSGAVEVDHNGSLDIVNSTITANVHPYNGAVTLFGGQLNVANSILWGNATAQLVVYGGAAGVRYSNIRGGWAGDGNLDVDPGFANTPGGDFRLRPGSACIDAADNTAVPADIMDLDGDGNFVESLPYDLAGAERFVDDPLTVDSGVGAPPLVDMGAYEFEPGCEGAPGDWDVDCDVDLSDYSILFGCLTGPETPVVPECEATDLDEDGDADLADFAVFQRLFLP